MSQFYDTLNRILNTFFHLPTLITIALLGVVIVWTLYDIGFNLGDGFIRLNSNRGNINLYWHNGCCTLD